MNRYTAKQNYLDKIEALAKDLLLEGGRVSALRAELQATIAEAEKKYLRNPCEISDEIRRIADHRV